MKDQKEITIKDLNANFEMTQEINSCLLLIDYIKAATTLVYNNKMNNIDISDGEKSLLKSKILSLNEFMEKLF